MQRATVVAPVKAFDERHVRFEGAKHLSHRNIGGVACQFQPAGAPALGLQIAFDPKYMDHLRQMVFRNIASLCNVRLAHRLVRIDGAEHQGAHGKVGSGGQAHPVVPRGKCDTLRPEPCHSFQIQNLT